mmetsp:Transcript_31457/g.58848  ORF Transcript_31457/g.58848 Transcript_31457/m.58848 type:complete len:219 (-) Transcript_31457:9-665(-)
MLIARSPSALRGARGRSKKQPCLPSDRLRRRLPAAMPPRPLRRLSLPRGQKAGRELLQALVPEGSGLHRQDRPALTGVDLVGPWGAHRRAHRPTMHTGILDRRHREHPDGDSLQHNPLAYPSLSRARLHDLARTGLRKRRGAMVRSGGGESTAVPAMLAQPPVLAEAARAAMRRGGTVERAATRGGGAVTGAGAEAEPKMKLHLVPEGLHLSRSCWLH